MSTLFTPFKIGSLVVPNRFVRSATAEHLSDDSGAPRPKLTDMYVALARGGVGMVITGHAYVHPGGRCRVGMSGIHDDSLIDAWAAVTAAVHRAGGLIAMQINHGGRQCDAAACGGTLVAPSPVPLNDSSPQPEELTERQIHSLAAAFGEAAQRVKAAGFDAVQIHAAHGYLVQSFLSPASNRRRDAWGGRLSRRMRFLETVASRVRDAVGSSYPVLTKLGTVDFVREGLTEKDSLEVIGHLAGMGLDAVEISGGIGGGNARAGIVRTDQEAYFLPIARQARHVTGLPILLVGGIRSREIMNRVLDEGSADFVSLSRPLIREPDLPTRIRNGQDAATCVSCNQCGPRVDEEGIRCHYTPTV